MSVETASILTVVFTGVVAFSLLLQGIAFWGMRQSVRSIANRFDSLSADVEKKLSSVSNNLTELITTVKPVAESILTIQKNLSATSDIIHKRVVDLDGFLETTTETARLHIARIQDVLDASSRKMTETLDLVQRGVLAPVAEATALIRGLRAGMNFLFRGRKSPSPQSHQDEEMFI